MKNSFKSLATKIIHLVEKEYFEGLFCKKSLSKLTISSTISFSNFTLVTQDILCQTNREMFVMSHLLEADYELKDNVNYRCTQ